MALMDPEPSRPELYSTRTSNSWKLPALAVAAVIVGLVVITHVGGPSLPTPTTGPDAAVASPTDGFVLTYRATPAPTKAPTIHQQLTGLMDRSADGLTYADGIPTAIGRQAVLRVHDALTVPLGRQLLIGGWYRPPNCRASGTSVRCPAPTLSDVPLVAGQGDVRTDFVALDSRLDQAGAYVVLAQVVKDPDCSIHGDLQCQPRLHVLQQVWSSPG